MNEGPGLRLGSSGLVLHGGLASEIGYDSNVLMANDAQDAGLLMLRLHLDLATLPLQRLDAESHPKLEFRLRGAFEYRQYLSPDNRVQFANQFNGFADVYLALKPRDPLSLRIYNNFVATNDARNLVVASQDTFVPRIYERFGLLGIYRPGNGPLELGLGSSIRLDYYIPGSFDFGRSYAVDTNLYGQLRVLPQTAVKVELRTGYLNYYTQDSPIPQSAPLRVTAGVNSLILPVLGVTAYAGYGNSLHFGGDPQNTTLVRAADQNRYNNFLAGAELRLRLLTRIHLALGYARDYSDTLFATYLSDDRLYLNYDHLIWRGLVAHLRFDTYFRNYGNLVRASELGFAGYNSDTRSDVLLNGNAELSWRVFPWLEFGVSYSLLYDKTDFAFTSQGGGSVPAGFIKHAVLARIDIAY